MARTVSALIGVSGESVARASRRCDARRGGVRFDARALRRSAAVTIAAVFFACGSRGSVSFFTTQSAASAPASQPAARQQTQSQPASRPVVAVKSRAELEAEFAALLTDAVLDGTWQATRVGAAMDEAPLGPAMKDRYTILAAHKAEADWWLIQARIQYADQDVVLPVRVRVVWAGDTPVITVDETSFPGLGTYSARVLFHGPFYSGVWKGGGHGGVMSGRVTRNGAAAEDDGGERPGDGESP